MTATPRARTIILTDASTVAYSEALAAYDGATASPTPTPSPSPTPTPAPSFTTLPSIAGTPQVGQALTAMDGVILNATEVTRRWLLGSAVKSTAATWLAASAGELVLEVTAAGPGGSTTARSNPVTVVEAGKTPTPSSTLRAFPRQGVGLQDEAFDYTGGSFPLLDRSKSSKWFPSSGGTLPVGSRTATGYPTVPWQCLQNIEGPLNAGVAQRYVIRTTYTGALTYGSLKQVSDTPPNRSLSGKREIQFDADPGILDKGCYGTIVGSIGFASNDTWEIIRLDQVALYDSGEIFNPAYIAEIQKLGVIRFMDWMQTNWSTQQNWADRTLPSYATYGHGSDGDAERRPAPIEVMIALANKAGVEPWFNPPHKATDDYLTKFAQMVKIQLRPDLRAWIEMSNEWGWNTNFGQAGYAAQQLPAIVGADSQATGWAGYRAAQCAIIFREVFDGDRRLMNVIGMHQANPNASLFKYAGARQAIAELGNISNANYAPARAAKYQYIADIFDAYAITTYTSGGLASTPSAKVMIEGWVSAPDDSGMAAAFRQMRNATEFTPGNNDHLSYLASTVYPAHAALAAQEGLLLVGYEGGPHLDRAGGKNPGGTQIWPASDPMAIPVQNFFNRLQYDARFGALTVDIDTAFRNAGGQLAMHLGDYGEMGAFGGYFLRHDLYTTIPSPRYDAVIGIQANPPATQTLQLLASTTGNFNVGANPVTIFKRQGGIGRVVITTDDPLTPGRELKGMRLAGVLQSTQADRMIRYKATDEAGNVAYLNLAERVDAKPPGKRFVRMVAKKAIGGSGPLTDGGIRPSLATVYFLGPNDAVIAWGATIVTGDQFSDGEGSMKLIDNNDNTPWTGVDGKTNYEIFDAGVGNAYNVLKIGMISRLETPERAMDWFDWEWSDDGEAWSQIFTTTNASYPNRLFVAVLNTSQ